MVEFALVASIFFLVLLVIIDTSRAILINTGVSDAARQAARQGAADAAVSDNTPFGTAAGQCSGTVFTQSVTGSGCLSDAQIRNTVAQVLRDTVADANVVLLSNTSAASCGAPPAGQVYVCVTPSQTAAPPSYTDCNDARARLGRAPQAGDLGGRSGEWTAPRFKGCFLIQVTVTYSFKPWTPVVTLLGPTLKLSSSTFTLAEY
jgi:Flp pilus assembly protein TadG